VIVTEAHSFFFVGPKEKIPCTV